MPPFTSARTRCRFGSNRRGLTLCAWLMLRPTTGPLPQISHRFAMLIARLPWPAVPGPCLLHGTNVELYQKGLWTWVGTWDLQRWELGELD